MADNVEITPGVGATIAADEINGTKHQRMKVEFGADGSASDVSSANPLPVEQQTPVAVEGTVAVDTELSAAAALTDTMTNPTTPMVGAGGMIWDATANQWERSRVSKASASSTTIGVQAVAPHLSHQTGVSYNQRNAAGDALEKEYVAATAAGVYNGTTFDRPRGDTGDAQANTGIPAVSSKVYNGATWDRSRGDTGDAQANTGIQANSSKLYNGATWDRPRSDSGDGQAATGIQAISGNLYNGTTYDRPRGAPTTDAQARTGVAATTGLLYNGSTYERPRSDTGGDAQAVTGIQAVSGNLYNGTTYDRPRGAPSADAQTRTGLVASTGLLFNGSTYDRPRSESGDAQADTGVQAVSGKLFNGTNWDRPRVAPAADAQVRAGIQATTQQLYNGSTYDRIRSDSGDTQVATGVQAVSGKLYNGATFDRARNNESEFEVLAQASRTVNTLSSTQTNYNARGVIVAMRVYTAGTGSLRCRIGIPFSGLSTQYPLDMPVTEAITGVGTFSYVLYPGAVNDPNASDPPVSQAVNKAVGLPLPRSWVVSIVHSDASAWEYAVRVAYIV